MISISDAVITFITDDCENLKIILNDCYFLGKKNFFINL